METVVQHAHPLLYLGILLLGGYAGGRAATALNLPRLSGYIVVGMLLSPSTTGILDRQLLDHGFGIVTEIALGIIAFAIGGALDLDKLKKLGNQILVITVLQALAVFVLVAGSVIFITPLLPGDLPGRGPDLIGLAILLGAICAATAPAAVLGVIHEYRARGPVTTSLLGVVSLDDGITLILFSVAGGIASSLAGSDVSWLQAVLIEPGREIFLSLAIGGGVGLLVRAAIPEVRRRKSLLGISLGAVFITSGMALSFHGSPLLACMMLGFTMANVMKHSSEWFESLERVEEPILALFFVIAGAHLDISAITAAGSLAIVIIIARTAGKLGGGFAGGALASASAETRKYLPIGLLPQAGVSIGLVLVAMEFIPSPEVAGIMVNAVLASVIVNELISPALVKIALTKAGEIKVGEE
jgi:Kef-type K+ transport system membrane component KefB